MAAILSLAITGILVTSTRSYTAALKSNNAAAVRTRSNKVVCSSTTIDTDLLTYNADAEKLDFENTFGVFATNKEFIQYYWQKKPYYTGDNLRLDNLADSFTMQDVKLATETDFLEAGRGTFQGNTGWQMAQVSKPRGKSFEDAKLRFEDIQMAMQEKSGTVVFNSAGGFIPQLAKVCLDAVTAFNFPVAINAYLTNAGQAVSAPLHTDKQDVFVMQTQGRKRWRVFAPPPPARMVRADPFARGKGKDLLEISELDAKPLLDIVLKPGQVLYVPGGFPHTTDTVNVDSGAGVGSDPSVHMTVGVDTHIWNFNYANLRRVLLAKAGIEDKMLITKLEPELYWKMQEALPFGFLFCQMIPNPSEDIYTPSNKRLVANFIKEQLFERIKQCEPQKYVRIFNDLSEGLNENEIIEIIIKMMDLHEEITDTFGKMYADVAFKITPTKLDLSFFRSQPYFQQLEKTMEVFEAYVNKKSRKTGGDASNGTGFVTAPMGSESESSSKVVAKGFGGKK